MLTNVTEHVIEQQGGCSGLQTICDKELLETKDANCKQQQRAGYTQDICGEGGPYRKKTVPEVNTRDSVCFLCRGTLDQ